MALKHIETKKQTNHNTKQTKKTNKQIHYRQRVQKKFSEPTKRVVLQKKRNDLLRRDNWMHFAIGHIVPLH